MSSGPTLEDTLRAAGAGAIVQPLLRYVAGEIGSELALMHCVLGTGDARALLSMLDAAASATSAPALDALAALAHTKAGDLGRTSALVQRGLTDIAGGAADPVAAIRAQFDAAVALAPEASVALYSLGSPEILDRATDEIVARLREWALTGIDRDVLDVGCGIGRIERALASNVRSIVGVDVSPAMIAEAQQRSGRLANVTFDVCEGRDLAAFADASFDLVVFVDAFPYLFAAGADIVERHFRDSARVLRAGGALLLLNYSYRGDAQADRDEVAQHAAATHLIVVRVGTRDFTLWDGVTFLLRKP